jgi:hypothetical protein
MSSGHVGQGCSNGVIAGPDDFWIAERCGSPESIRHANTRISRSTGALHPASESDPVANLFRFSLAFPRPPTYFPGSRIYNRCQIILDKSLGKVKYPLQRINPVAFWHLDIIPTRSFLFRIPAQSRTQAATENQHNKMQNYCKTIGALAAASALVAGNAQAEVEYQLSAEYSSMYLFRGMDLGDNLVDMSLDAAYDYNGVNISGGVWAAAFDNAAQRYTGIPTGNQVDNEVDAYLEVGKDFGFANLSVGYIYYWNLGAFGEDAQEIPFTISRDFGWADLYLTYFWSVDGVNNDGYTELGGSHSWELNQCVSLNYASNIGFQMEEGDFTAWTNKISLDWGFAENAKLSPFFAFSIDCAQVRGIDDEILGGSMLSVSF